MNPEGDNFTSFQRLGPLVNRITMRSTSQTPEICEIVADDTELMGPEPNAAASAVSEFAPTFVYPYHYRGRDGGTQDPQAFAKMVGVETEVRLGDWY